MNEAVKKEGRPGSWIWICAALLFLAAVISFLVIQVNEFTITVRLIGEEVCFLEYGEHYFEPGAEATLSGTFLLKKGVMLPERYISISHDLDVNTLGKYTVSYTASLAGYSGQASRHVSIIDTKSPVITLVEDPTAFLHPETGYHEAGFTAFDNYDGDITDRVISVLTDGKMTYSVIDSSGNPAYAERKVYDHDFIPPQIHLEGGDRCAIFVGNPYEEPGFSVTDNYDTDLSHRVQVQGKVDWLRPGSYPLTYSVRDSSGNYASVTRVVVVEAMPQPGIQWPAGKTVYLTFDDGPSPYTLKLLDILDRYGAKATFFVKNTEQNHLMKEIVDRGHSIGIHTASHDYYEIYASPEAYFQDLREIEAIIKEETGTVTTLLRFPGGSSNTVSVYTCSGIMTILSHAVPDAGYQYFDWNVDSKDASTATTRAAVAANVIQGISENNTSLVLQHDIHEYSVDAVEDILAWGTENGYEFLALTETSPGFRHDLRN